ncbi:heme-binding protein 1-like [Panulirus ornatus]|uniref:heme-binding protein 1-like n=1 Tax=Panulirus ornatus TaxID=150431 RepID=UPI003A8AB189
MRWLALCTLLVVATAARASFFESMVAQLGSIFTTYEEAPYIVEMKYPGYEKRTYEAKKWVCSEETGRDDRMMPTLFQRLYNYISGQNERKISMAMTVPVTTEFTVNCGTEEFAMHQTSEKKYTMCFFIGEHYQTDPPQPNDPTVFIQNRPEIKIFTRRVGGYLNKEADWLEEAGKLAAVMEQDCRTVSLNHTYWAGYDQPMKLWFRRNEVWFPAPM